MPIPSFNAHGLLPEGLHDCTLDEIGVRFGAFQGSDRRPWLWASLQAFTRELKAAGIAVEMLINGSFVTAKSAPEDVDLILVLPTTHDFGRDLSPDEYNTLSAQRVRRRHGLDLLVARADSDQYHRYVKLFQQVRLEPERVKGILRMNL